VSLLQGVRLRGQSAARTWAASGQRGPRGPVPPEIVQPEPIERGSRADPGALAAWSSIAHGNAESAGKHRSGKTRQGNQALRTGLTQLAQAAARTKGTYLSALYQCLAARRGKKRAIIAVAHSIVVSAFHMLIRDEPYRELGGHYFDNRRQAHLVDQLTRRIERLGYRVTLEPIAAA
jgi:transposase